MTTSPVFTAPTRPPKLRGLWSSEGLALVEARMEAWCAGAQAEEQVHATRPNLRILPDPGDPLGPIALEHLSGGGKRLRARLALGGLEVLGGQRSDAVGWAVACELLHNASIVHDDIQDGDKVRRGRAAVWAVHGTAQAINTGDLMLFLAFRAVEDVPRGGDVKWDLTRLLSQSAERMVRGQAAELDLLRRRRLDWQSYVHSVEGKTASLFALPIEGAARIAGATLEGASRLADDFRSIGVLFQIQDDILDLWGDKGRGEPGSDLREGKVSALVVEHLRLHPQDRDGLVALLAKPRHETTDAEVRAAIHRFATGGALDAVWERMSKIEARIGESEALAAHPRLHALAIELCALALAPIAHTAPNLENVP